MSLITPDFGLIFWMTLIFGIVFFLLAKFGFPMITGMVDERNERISASIAKAKEAEEKLSTLAQESERIIREAEVEQARILKETSEAREKMLAQAREDAEQVSAKMIEQAKLRIAQEKEAAVRDIRSQVADLSVQVAEKIMRTHLKDSDAQKELVDRYFDEI